VPASAIPDLIAEGETGFPAARPAGCVLALEGRRDEPELFEPIRQQAGSWAQREYPMARFHDRILAA